MTPIVRLEKGGFDYQDRSVFGALDMEVAPGEILTVLGANGCGKTTLLNCLNGTLKLSSGKVLIEGRDVAEMSVAERARRIGLVFQEHTPPFPFSVLEVVRMGRAPHLGFFSRPASKDTERALDAIDEVGLAALKDKPYTQISAGERQLVLIARTITQEPQIILLDEPTSHLDFRNQSLVLAMIRRLAASGTSVVMSTHLPNHALLCSSRVALMSGGRFMAVGRAKDVITERNLRKTYGIDVRVLSVVDPQDGKTVRFCVPVLEAMRDRSQPQTGCT